MVCTHCDTPNSDVAKFCRSCGSSLGGAPPPPDATVLRNEAPVDRDPTGNNNAAPEWPGEPAAADDITPPRGTPVVAAGEPTIARFPSGTAPEPTSERYERPIHDDAAETTIRIAPTIAGGAASFGGPDTVDAAPFDQERPTPATARRGTMLAVAAGVTALVGVGAFLLFTSDDDPDSVATSDTSIPAEQVAAVPSTPDSTVEPPVVPVATEPVSVVPEPTATTATSVAVETTVAVEPTVAPEPTIAPATTEPPPPLPETTAAPEPPAPPPTAPPLWAIPAVPPPPEPVSGPGSPQIIAEVLPSTFSAVEAQPFFLRIQAFADAVAAGDWAAARTIDANPPPTDADYATAFGELDRSSVILLDTTIVDGNYEMLVITMNLEAGGSRTRVDCSQYVVDSTTTLVFRRAGFELELWQDNVTPEELRANAPLINGLVQRCNFPAIQVAG